MKNTWEEVKQATNFMWQELMKKENKKASADEDCVGNFFNNNLPRALKEVAYLAYVHDYRPEQSRIVLNGIKQLEEDGAIIAKRPNKIRKR